VVDIYIVTGREKEQKWWVCRVVGIYNNGGCVCVCWGSCSKLPVKQMFWRVLKTRTASGT
jgi:hypothetical protein